MLCIYFLKSSNEERYKKSDYPFEVATSCLVVYLF